MYAWFDTYVYCAYSYDSQWPLKSDLGKNVYSYKMKICFVSLITLWVCSLFVVALQGHGSLFAAMVVNQRLLGAAWDELSLLIVPLILLNLLQITAPAKIIYIIYFNCVKKNYGWKKEQWCHHTLLLLFLCKFCCKNRIALAERAGSVAYFKV